MWLAMLQENRRARRHAHGPPGAHTDRNKTKCVYLMEEEGEEGEEGTGVC